MHEIQMLILVMAAGIFLGMAYFIGLWWTIRLGLNARRPALLFAGSWLLRTGLTLAGFYLLANNHGQRLLIGLLGFVIGRLIVTHFIEASSVRIHLSAKETSHAPES